MTAKMNRIGDAWRGWLHRMVRRINRRHYNAAAHASVCAAYSAGIINSKQMHDILGRWNRACWPEWTKPKPKWVCSNCGNTEDKEREIMCWKCGKGEMLYTPNT